MDSHYYCSPVVMDATSSTLQAARLSRGTSGCQRDSYTFDSDSSSSSSPPSTTHTWTASTRNSSYGSLHEHDIDATDFVDVAAYDTSICPTENYYYLETLIAENQTGRVRRTLFDSVYPATPISTTTTAATATTKKGSHGRKVSRGSIGVTPPQAIAARGRVRVYRTLHTLPIAAGTTNNHSTKMMGNISVESMPEEQSAPSSPPELSYSKSSKSSSSIHSDDDMCSGSDVGLTKEGHFEDVVLEEEQDAGSDSVEGDDCNQPPDVRPTLHPRRRPPPRSLTIDDVTLRANSARRTGKSPPLRPRANGSVPQAAPARKRFPVNPSLQGPVTGVLRDQSLNLPNGRSMQRAASSPTSPYMRGSPHGVLSRSPSPNKAYSASYAAASLSPNSVTGSTPKGSYEAPNNLSRRPSWQPGRKTVKELEAEYNDEDEEVPDEAILENVPISPLPGHYSTAKSPNLSVGGLRSTTPSPHRRPYANLHSANIPKGAKRPKGPPLNGMPRSPKSRPPMMPHSATVGPGMYSDPLNRQHRSKSWTEDLNFEARELSQKLEEWAQNSSLVRRNGTKSATSSAGSTPPRPSSLQETGRAKTTFAEIPSVPPLQKGNIMIDPLPISKEKEAVLSRTRPSWLPPKDQKEEKKHLKEFQQMMARAAEAEKKRALREQESRENKEEAQGSIARIWEQHVLPNWEAVVREPRTRELWWRGVTPANRGEVWQKAVGNELELSAASFDAALARAHAIETKVADMSPEERANSKEAAWLDAIARDVPNTFAETKMYARGASLHQNLADVLKAYSMYRSDVGYVYGTHLVAGIVCPLLRPAEAFVLLANIMNRSLPLAFLVHDQPAMQRTYDYTLQTLRYKFAKLHDHLTSPGLNLKPEEYLDPMFRCLFAYNLPYEHAARIWDIFVFEGDKTFVRAAVAILGRLESKLYVDRDAVMELIGWRNENLWDMGSEDDFIAAVREAGKIDNGRKSSV